MAKSKKKHYVSNEEFYREMVQYKKDCEAAEAVDDPLPRIPESIGEKILAIATRLSYNPNFIRFPSIRQEMIGDAVENCILYIRNFNHVKYDNPFSYFTQITYWAYVRRIKKERKQFLTKAKYIQNIGVDLDINVAEIQDHNLGEEYHNTYVDYLKVFYDVDLKKEDAKEKAKKKKAKKKKKTLRIKE